MKISTFLQIGEYHLNHCEDYLFIGETGNDRILCAVMDGCTNGSDSYFMATLTGKLLRKIVRELNYEALYQKRSPRTIKDELKMILDQLFQELKQAKNQLMLEKNELLSTLTLLLIDQHQEQGISIIIGDGTICINGKITAFDQDNHPDYLGFHLNENFETWFSNQTQLIEIDLIQDISITTDGISSFVQVHQTTEDELIDPAPFLLCDNTLNHDPDMLSKKMKVLEHQYGLKPSDDLAIIRIINQMKTSN